MCINVQFPNLLHGGIPEIHQPLDDKLIARISSFAPDKTSVKSSRKTQNKIPDLEVLYAKQSIT